MSLTAGVATVDLTPADGSIIACFPDRSAEGDGFQPRRAEGAHDRLEARVLALSDGEEHLTLCALDLPGIRLSDVQRIRARLSELAPELDGPGLVLACSHTHSGPDTLYLFGGSPDDPWIEQMVASVAEAIVEAHGSRVPAQIGFERAAIELSHNRRVIHEDGRFEQLTRHVPGVTEGPVDPDLTVLRVDAADGESLAVAFHFTAHSLTLGPRNMCFSADYPGVARSVVDEALAGATSLFLNGAAGNVHPRECMRGDREAAEAIGTPLGRTVAALAREPEGDGDVALGSAGRTLTFTNRMDPSHEVAVEVACLRIGPAILGVVPGEYFVEFQLAFKQQVDAEYATLIGYANGWPGYIPTRESYAEGGYGVDAYPGDPAELSRTCLPEGAGEAMLEALLDLADSLA